MIPALPEYHRYYLAGALSVHIAYLTAMKTVPQEVIDTIERAALLLGSYDDLSGLSKTETWEMP